MILDAVFEEESTFSADFGVVHTVSAAGGTGGTANPMALTIIRNILAKAVYTEDVSSMLTALDEAIANPDSGDTGGDSGDNGDTGGDSGGTTETVEEILPVTWTGRPDKTTYEYYVEDKSGGSSQAKYQQQVSFIQTETSGGTLYVDLDTTKVSQMAFRMFIWDESGNPYKHSNGIGGGSPVSGDLSAFTLNNPGEQDAMSYANGSWSYRIPDGCKVLLLVHPNVNHMIDEELTSAAKPIYAWVDAVTFKNEIITAKIVKEG